MIKVTAGYTGGSIADPSYEQVSAGGTGHAESVEIIYDPRKISYTRLLDVFWHNIDPTQYNRQFCDSGNQYRTAIFYHSARQKRLALASRRSCSIRRASRPAASTPRSWLRPLLCCRGLSPGLLQENPIRYKFYRWNCGRDQRLEKVWGHAPEH